VADAVVVAAAVLLAQYVRFGQSPAFDNGVNKQLTGFSILFAILWLTALAIFHTRSSRVIGAGIEEYRRVLSASFWTFGAIAIATLLAKLDVARGYLAIALPVGTTALLLTRHLWRNRLRRERARGRYQTSVLAVGDEGAVSELARELTRSPADGYHIVGVCIPGYGESREDSILVKGQEIPIVGDETRALDATVTFGADAVAVAGTEHFGGRGLRRLMWDLEALNVDLLVSPGVTDVASARLAMRPVAGFPLLIHVEKPQYEGAKRFQKRAFDFCFALVAMVVTLPVFLVAAVAIKLTSRGRVFYSAERIGLRGKPFNMFKFRTMVQDADVQLQSLIEQNETEGGVLFKIHDDPRITSVGKILRRYSIDELPQFINVLNQEMSVVGPRPPLRREVDTYDGEVMRRLLVKPGITGLWQVSGRSDLSWEESVRLDLCYVENWSMVGDLIIIAKTLRAVLCRSGAY